MERVGTEGPADGRTDLVVGGGHEVEDVEEGVVDEGAQVRDARERDVPQPQVARLAHLLVVAGFGLVRLGVDGCVESVRAVGINASIHPHTMHATRR